MKTNSVVMPSSDNTWATDDGDGNSVQFTFSGLPRFAIYSPKPSTALNLFVLSLIGS